VDTSCLDLESGKIARVVGASYIQFGRFLEELGFDRAKLNPPDGMRVDEIDGSLQYVVAREARLSSHEATARPTTVVTPSESSCCNLL